MKFSKKNKTKHKLRSGGKGKSGHFNQKPVVKTRKELRKEERQQKKVSKVNSYLNRIKNYKDNLKNNESKIKNVAESSKTDVSGFKDSPKPISKPVEKQSREPVANVPLTDLSKENRKSKHDQKVLEKKMKKQRLQSLKNANKAEDKIISNLEKQLKLNKRKSKVLPASFVSSGLDYILDVCNPEKMKNFAESEKYLQDSGSEFEDDLATVKGQNPSKNISKQLSQEDSDEMHIDDDDDYQSDSSDASFDDGEGSKSFKKFNVLNKTTDNVSETSEDDLSDDSLLDDLQDNDDSDDEIDLSDNYDSLDDVTMKNTILNSKSDKISPEKVKKRKKSVSENSETNEETSLKEVKGKNKKKVKLNITKVTKESNDKLKGKFVNLKQNKEEIKGQNESKITNDETFSDENLTDEDDKLQDEGNDTTWEDIYGRTRDKQGNVVEATKGKYIPPALRVKDLGVNAQKREALERLRRQLKGLLNRLAESNMHGIATEIEQLYMKNSRNDMNESLIALFTEAIVSSVHTPERLIMEHAMLSAILHANIGTEVGAYILQTFVTSFDKLLSEGTEIGDKRLDNLLAFICHLYTFKVFDNSLLYDILGVLCDKFKEKEIELILVVLRNSGFSLRKDDPLALKELVLRIQRLASEASALKNDSRVSFMLDVLLKIKNNNMSKLPQYDPSHSEHLKKIIKTMIRKGNYVTELKISLLDLLHADERGRWWIVGSAWTGPSETEQNSNQENPEKSLVPTMSDQLTQLAKKLRINTDIRKNIFCILMTAEDFEDAFEKLLKLGLKGQTMNEIIHVLLHCLLQEKEYNHYYALIANRFSQTDRKYRMVAQYSIWDKFKEVDNMKPFQVTNLAKLLAFMFIEGTLPLSVLKVIQLVEMTKSNVRLIRQILLSILYHKDETTSAGVFLRLNKSTKLHLFREGLRLFLHHFLLKNMKDTDQDYDFLKQRITIADMALQVQSF